MSTPIVPSAAPAAPARPSGFRIWVVAARPATLPAAAAGVAALGTAGTGAYFANSAPVVQRVPITLRGLDPALDGFRIVTFSDGHLSST